MLFIYLRPHHRRYALNGAEGNAILMQRLVKVDGKVRTEKGYPAGFMDVIDIDKTDEHFRLVYDTKGRYVVHRISKEEAAYKLCKVKTVQFGKGAHPYCTTHDGRTLRFPDPEIKVCFPVDISSFIPQHTYTPIYLCIVALRFLSGMLCKYTIYLFCWDLA